MTRRIPNDYRDDPLLPLLHAKQQMEEVHCYLTRGRRFADLSRDDLERCYAKCVWLVVVNAIGGPGLDQALTDLGAELALRRLPEPLHLIEPWLPAIRAQWDQDARDPRVQAEMRRMLGGLAQEMAHPKH
jgi:hypothetical protein